MIIAVISDTHDNLKMTESFVKDVKQFAPDYLIHLGDIVSPFVIPVLAKLEIPGIIAKGNNDGDTDYIGELCYKSGFKFVIPPYKFELAGKSFIISHRPIDTNKIDISGFDYYLYGHTHFHKIEESGRIHIINPGTVSGYVSGKSTYIIINTEVDEVKLREL